MKLSIKKRIGWTQVKGGNVLRVAQTHGVSTDTLSKFVEQKQRWPNGKPAAVFAKPGDLALEILHVHGDVCGYTYLSGDAIQLNCYDAMPFWFEPASSARFEIPDVRAYDDGEEESFFVDLLQMIMRAKYSDIDLVVFDYTCPKGQPSRAIGEAITGIYPYAPVVDTPIEPENRRTHIVGHIHEHHHKGGTDLHIQPPREASDFCATPFQIELALSAVEKACRNSA